MLRYIAFVAAVVMSLVFLSAGVKARAALSTPGRDEVIVTAVGESAHSFEEAKEDALRRAVEMGAGKEVFADTRVADFALMHDTIISRSAGYVRSYDIIEKNEVRGVYMVKVRAVVAVGKIKEDCGALRILIERKGRPNLLIVTSEEGVNLPQWTGNAAEFKLRELFGEKGFDIVDDETLAEIVGRDVTHAMLAQDEAKAVAVAQQLHAGYVITGRALLRAGRPEPAYTLDLVPVSVDLLVKVVATDNAQQLASKQASASRALRDPTTAAGQVLNQAAAEIFSELLRRILVKWSEDLDVGSKVTCIGTRIPTNILDAIVDRLRATDGIKGVSIVDHNPQLSTLSVVTRLEAKELGKVIVRAAEGKVDVTEISPGRIGFKFVGNTLSP